MVSERIYDGREGTETLGESMAAGAEIWLLSFSSTHRMRENGKGGQALRVILTPLRFRLVTIPSSASN